jgi:hypothetical protein
MFIGSSQPQFRVRYGAYSGRAASNVKKGLFLQERPSIACQERQAREMVPDKCSRCKRKAVACSWVPAQNGNDREPSTCERAPHLDGVHGPLPL